MTESKSLDIEAILARLPHRYPFLLVDRVLSVEPGKSIVALKNVSVNEAYFVGHFPDHPVMPGVLVVEALAQAGGLLAWETASDAEHPDPLSRGPRQRALPRDGASGRPAHAQSRATAAPP